MKRLRSFSILNRIELAETTASNAKPSALPSFSILNRIELAETLLLLDARIRKIKLSVSSIGSNSRKPILGYSCVHLTLTFSILNEGSATHKYGYVL